MRWSVVPVTGLCGTMSNLLDARIFVAGHRGLVGSAIVRRLQRMGASSITRSRDELDLTDQAQVDRFFADQRPEYVFLAAAKVGGIRANSTFPADFIRDNLAIQSNVIDAAWRNGTRKLLFLGSSCIYPRDCAQPIREDYLLTGPLEPTNQPYAIAKIAGIEMCRAYRRQYGFDAICAMPTNLYGPGDNFHPENSHVLPALIRRFHEATRRGDPEVTIWGSGPPLREFLHVDGLADASVFLMDQYSSADIINVGSGEELSIIQLAELIAAKVGYTGRIRTDPDKPDGTPRKLLDSSRIRAMGWRPKTHLADGIASTWESFALQQARDAGH